MTRHSSLFNVNAASKVFLTNSGMFCGNKLTAIPRRAGQVFHTGCGVQLEAKQQERKKLFSFSLAADMQRYSFVEIRGQG